MILTVKALVDRNGKVELLEDIQFSSPRIAFVIILDDETSSFVEEPALLSERSLAEDWNRREEDVVWSVLQSAS